ncbi:hypothetical protein FRC09_009836 [Ceratobasidium sp. 395]|nr:hypothetical protein FRC09_009836 [Ceratobasidium sp. 395]
MSREPTAMHSHDNSYRPCPLCSGPMKDALRTVLSGSPVSVEVLRTVLDHASSSEDWLSLCNPDVIPACVRILKQYSRESPILEGQKGILCLQLLSLAFQVALLTFQDDPFAFTTLSSIDPELKLTDHVLSIVSRQVQRSEELTQSTGIPQRTIIPWLTSEHAGVLLNLLYRERFRLLTHRFTRPDHWNGFSILLFGIWGHMRGLGASLNPGTNGPKLLDVACRFMAVAPSNENEDNLSIIVVYTMRNIAAMFGAVDLFPSIQSSPNQMSDVDTVSDTMMVVRCYITRLSSGPPDLKLWFHLFEWAHGFVHPDISELMLPFFRVSYAGIWGLLDPAKDPQPMTADRICDLVDFGGQLVAFTGTILEAPILTRGNKDALLEVVRQNDIFALLARLLLLRLTPITFSQKDKKNLGQLYEGLLHQIREFGVVLEESSNSTVQLFKKAFPDWLKAAYLFQELCFMSDPNTPTNKHLTSCTMGTAFEL